MSNSTFTTGNATVALGFMVTGKFIESMGLKPAGSVKGNPIWAMSDWPKLCAAISDHLMTIKGKPPTREAAAPKPSSKKAAATTSSGPAPYSDDDEDATDVSDL